MQPSIAKQHAQVVKSLFEAFAMNYCGLWTSRFPTEDSKNKGLQQWASQLSDFSFEEIKRAIALCLKSLSEPPTIAKFREQAALARNEIRKPSENIVRISSETELEREARERRDSQDWRDMLVNEYERLGSLEKARESMKKKNIYPFIEN